MGRQPADPVRVLVVAPYATVGGAELWLLRLLAATDRLECEVVLLQDGPFREELQRRDIPVELCPVGRRPVEIAAAVPSLARLIRRRQPDVVLGNGVKAQLIAAPACWLAGAPTVWAKHDHSYDAILARLLGRMSDAVVAAVEELGEPVRRDDVVVVPPPRPAVDPAIRDDARHFFAQRGVQLGERPVLAMVTRLVPYKGVEDAISALGLPGGKSWELAIIGEDDASSPGERQRLEALALAAGVTDRVRWLGPLPQAGHWLAAFDAVAVLTKPAGSRTPGREGFGTAAFEAMLAGVPVIGTDGGAVTRRLEGRAGLAVPAGDPHAVAAALEQLSDAGLRRAAGAAGRELLRAHPTEGEVADSLATVLAAACGRPGAGRPATDPLSIVVPLYNEGVGVDDIAEQLLAHVTVGDEVVLVDDGSTDDTGDRARRLAARSDGRIRVVHRERNGGVGAARNSGVAAARNAVVAFTDAGCTLTSTWLSGLRQAFAERPPPDFVAGVYHVSSDRVIDTAMAVSCYPDVDEARRPDWLARLYARLFGRAFTPERPAGRSFAVTVDTFRLMGGFREDMAATEDVDFSTAVARARMRCVLAVGADLQWRQAPLLDSARMYFKYGRGDARSGDRATIVRDLTRALTLLAVPLLLRHGGRGGRTAVLCGSAAYLSLPLRRAAKRPNGGAVMMAVPLTLAVRDVAKAAGFVAELLCRAGRA